MNLVVRVVGRVSPTVARVSPPPESLLSHGPPVASVLAKDLLRVSQAGGGYHPQFADWGDRPLVAKAIGIFRRHVGDARATPDDALVDLKIEADDFRLARGFASLLDREVVPETAVPLLPVCARRAALKAMMSVGGVATEEERVAALDCAASSLGSSPARVGESLVADREVEQVFSEFDPWRTPDGPFVQYNLSLAQTALFDATEVRIRSSDPKAVVSTAKRFRPMYEIWKTDADRKVVVIGPDALFQRTRRYGTAFACLLRSVATAGGWRFAATVDDRGIEYEMTLTSDNVPVPGIEPMAELSFDSGAETDFAVRLCGLDLDWLLVQEPELLETGTSVMTPDFASDHAHADFCAFFEIMGFWVSEHVEKKLGQLANVEDVELVAAVDESLGVGEGIAARDHRTAPYTGFVRVKDAADVLHDHEPDLVADAASSLPAEFMPDDDVVTLSDLVVTRGVSVDALDNVAFPKHRLVGRMLVRPVVLDTFAGEIGTGLSLSAAESALDDRGLDNASAVLSRLGYWVEWEGLTGGTVRGK